MVKWWEHVSAILMPFHLICHLRIKHQLISSVSTQSLNEWSLNKLQTSVIELLKFEDGQVISSHTLLAM